jgi:hypothetical protein
MGRYTEPERQREIIIEHDAIPYQTETNANNRVMMSDRVRRQLPENSSVSRQPEAQTHCTQSFILCRLACTEVSSEKSLGFTRHVVRGSLASIHDLTQHSGRSQTPYSSSGSGPAPVKAPQRSAATPAFGWKRLRPRREQGDVPACPGAGPPAPAAMAPLPQ